MKVFIDQGRKHPLIARIGPYLKKEGIELMNNLSPDCHVHYSQVVFSPGLFLFLKKVLRLDGAFYNFNDLRQNRILKDSYNAADHIIFQSEYSKQLCEHTFKAEPPKPSTIIYNAGEEWEKGLKHEDFNIVCCAKWRRWKRLPEVLAIFKELPFPARLHIIGEWGESTDNIKYYGMINYEDMKTIYKLMDVGIHIAKRDCCPNSVIEFMSAGLPIVVSDMGGGAEELARMYPLGRVVEGDIDPGKVNVVEQYSDEWYCMTEEFRNNAIEVLKRLYETRPKGSLPNWFSPEFVAKQYAKVFKEVK
jgi:glycosyltransferase involved in cell wall biosynthesis